jgi:hypothetical protein
MYILSYEDSLTIQSNVLGKLIKFQYQEKYILLHIIPDVVSVRKRDYS